MSVKVEFDNDGWAEVSDTESCFDKVLIFSPAEWEVFITEVKDGKHDANQRLREVERKINALEFQLSALHRERDLLS